MDRDMLFQKYGQVVEPGRIIFKEGEPGETMCIIQKGRVKITKRVGQIEKILMILNKGDFFGEMAIITQTPRTATASAIDTCELLMFNRQGFTSMISKNTNIAMNIIEKLCLRLEKADNQIRDLAKRDIKSLVISALNDFRKSTKTGERDTVLYGESVRHIAEQTSSTAEEVETQLKRLIESGLLSMHENTLHIVKPGELDVLAGYLEK